MLAYTVYHTWILWEIRKWTLCEKVQMDLDLLDSILKYACNFPLWPLILRIFTTVSQVPIKALPLVVVFKQKTGLVFSVSLKTKPLWKGSSCHWWKWGHRGPSCLHRFDFQPLRPAARQPRNVGNLSDCCIPKLASVKQLYGSVSKPCTPGEHQNSW